MIYELIHLKAAFESVRDAKAALDSINFVTDEGLETSTKIGTASGHLSFAIGNFSEYMDKLAEIVPEFQEIFNPATVIDLDEDIDLEEPDTDPEEEDGDVETIEERDRDLYNDYVKEQRLK